MKKHLLLFASLGIVLSTKAIDRNAVCKHPKNNPVLNRIDAETGTSFSNYNLAPNASPNPLVAASSSAPQRIKAGSSPNLFTSIYGMMNKVYANQDLEMISLVRRKNADDPGNSGYVQASVSTDLGGSFDTTLAVLSDDINLCRYPSGAIFNPPGNTNPDNALIVACGPWHPGADWQGNFFASVRTNGTNRKVWIQDNLAPGNTQSMDLMRTDIQTTTDGHVYISGSEYLDVNNTTDPGWVKGVLVKGTYVASGDSFTWSTRGFPHAFALDPADGSKKVFGTTHTAWSEDGQVGYFIYNGVDSATSFNSYQPIVYKTSDAGANWSLMPIFNFGTLTPITDVIRETRQGTKRPWIGMTHGYDVVVDKNDQLHIACMVSSASTDDPDSLDFTWTIPMHLFDLYTTECGWSANYIDSLQTTEVADANSYWSDGGGIGWGARINIGRTTDGSKIFYTWTDTEPALWNNPTENLFPDIKGRGYDVDNDVMTPVINFTADDIVNAGKNFWNFSSPIDLVLDDTLYVVPTTIADSRAPGDPGTGPIQHKYLKGVNFTESQFSLPANTCADFTGSVSAVSCGTTSVSINEPLVNPCYLWDGVPGNSSITNLSGGSHTVTVTSGGCSTSFTFNVPNPFGTINSSTVAATGCTTNDATATVSVANPGNPTYTWNTTPPQTNATATGLMPNTSYEVTIVDGQNCAVVSVTTPPAPQFDDTVTVAFTSPTGCTTPDGSASVSVLASGNFTYSWNTTPVQTNDTLTGVPPGTYSCVVTDAGGCSETFSVTIPTPQGLGPDLTFTTTNPLCSNTSNGSATVIPTGGTSPYTYAWSNNLGTSATANNMAAGTYTITVTDANGCFTVDTVSVTAPSAISITSNTVVANSDPSNPNGSITIVASGGTGALTYQLNNGTPQAVNVFTGLNFGAFTVTVIDANQCTASTTLLVPNFTSVRDMDADKALTVSPNPTNGILNIKTDNNQLGSQLRIVSITGQELFTSRINSTMITYDMSHLSKGVYFVQLIGNQKVSSKRVIKN